jgi:UDPglucose 6-dehydrogenase
MLSDLNQLGTRSAEENERYLTVTDDPYQATDAAHAVALVTEWDQFKTLDYQRIYNHMLKPAFLFDGRRVLDREALKAIGFRTYTIGE